MYLNQRISQNNLEYCTELKRFFYMKSGSKDHCVPNNQNRWRKSKARSSREILFIEWHRPWSHGVRKVLTLEHHSWHNECLPSGIDTLDSYLCHKPSPAYIFLYLARHVQGCRGRPRLERRSSSRNDRFAASCCTWFEASVAHGGAPIEERSTSQEELVGTRGYCG